MIEANFDPMVKSAPSEHAFSVRPGGYTRKRGCTKWDD